MVSDSTIIIMIGSLPGMRRTTIATAHSTITKINCVQISNGCEMHNSASAVASSTATVNSARRSKGGSWLNQRSPRFSSFACAARCGRRLSQR